MSSKRKKTFGKITEMMDGFCFFFINSVAGLSNHNTGYVADHVKLINEAGHAYMKSYFCEWIVLRVFLLSDTRMSETATKNTLHIFC